MIQGDTEFLFGFLSMMLLVLPGIAYSVTAIDGFNPNADNTVISIALQADGKIPWLFVTSFC
jgi:hypothetical protein